MLLSKEHGPFLTLEKGEDNYVLAEDNTLKGVRFSVKISGEEDWETITFNDFCALAAEKVKSKAASNTNFFIILLVLRKIPIL